MPSYHSSFNDKESVKVCCAMSVLPLKTKFRGPAPRGVEGEDDVIDEALKQVFSPRSARQRGPALGALRSLWAASAVVGGD